MKFNFRWFLEIREYRSMYVQYVIGNIIRFLKIPFWYIKIIINEIKFERTSPSSWERYLKLKELEKEAKTIGVQSTAYVQFCGAISLLTVSLITYCDYVEKNTATDEKLQKLHSEFYEFKEKAIECLNELEEVNVMIPSELKEMIKSTYFNSFNNLDEVNTFSDKIRALCDLIDVDSA